MIKKIYLLLFVTIAFGQDLIPDTSFGTNGFTLLTEKPNLDGSKMKLLSDGSIILSTRIFNSTTSQSEMVIVKFTSNGSLDTSFGVNGYYTVSHSDDNVAEIYLDSNENIYIATSSLNSYIEKINTSGALVTTFGVNGTKEFLNSFLSETAIVEGNNLIFGLSQLSDNKIIKLDSNGNLIPPFGTNGEITIQSPNSFIINKIIKSSDDNFIVTKSDFKVYKFLNDGTLDVTFGTNGIINLPFTQTQGSVMSFRTSDNDYIIYNQKENSEVVKYNSNGVIQTSFGTNGLLILNSMYVNNIEENNSKYFFTGTSITNFNTKIYAINTNGSFDISFGNSGDFEDNTNSYSEFPFDLIIRNDNFYVSGLIKNPSNTYSPFVSRYIPNSLSNTNFDLNNNIYFSNPIEEELTIISENNKIEKVEFYSLDGKLVKSANKSHFSVADLNSQLYILKCYFENGEVLTRKILKK